MQRLLLLTITVIILQFASAQTIPTFCISFGSGQGGRNLCGVATFDGGYVIGGISYYGGNGQNNYIAKYDGNGNIAWSHDVGSNFVDDFYGITETSDHHTLATGYLNGKMIVIKYTADGVQAWAKSISVTGTTFGYSIIETSDGNILISGSSSDFSNYFAVVIKLDSDGNLLWNKNFDVISDSGDDGYS